MTEAILNIVILLAGVGLGYYKAKGNDEKVFRDGIQAGVDLVMPHLDEVRQANRELVEVIKNVTNRNTIH